MAVLEHVKGDRWRVRVHDSARGGYRSRTFTANGIRAAKRKAASVETAIQAELNAEHVYAGTIAGLVDDWLQIKRRDLSPSTMVAYERHAAAIKDELGRIPVDQLTGRDLDRWWLKLADKGQNAPNILAIRRTLRAILNYGRKVGRLERVATEHDTPPSRVAHELQPPTSAAVATILANLPSDREWARAVKLLIFTGMRRGEVVGLRWDGWDGHRLAVRHSIVETKAGPVHVGPTKGKRSRVLDVLPAAAVDALDDQSDFLVARDIDSPWVFPDLITDRTGQTPRRPGWVSLMWGRHRDKYGAKKIGLHAFRHWYATWLLDNGVPITVVSRLLGHADVSTTLNIYAHRTEEGTEMARQAAALIGTGPKALNSAESSGG